MLSWRAIRGGVTGAGFRVAAIVAINALIERAATRAQGEVIVGRLTSEEAVELLRDTLSRVVVELFDSEALKP